MTGSATYQLCRCCLQLREYHFMFLCHPPSQAAREVNSVATTELTRKQQLWTQTVVFKNLNMCPASRIFLLQYIGMNILPNLTSIFRQECFGWSVKVHTPSQKNASTSSSWIRSPYSWWLLSWGHHNCHPASVATLLPLSSYPHSIMSMLWVYALRLCEQKPYGISALMLYPINWYV